MSDHEKCKQEQREAVRLLEKLDSLPVDLLVKLPDLYADVKELKEVVAPLQSIVKHKNKILWAFAIIGVTGADLDTIKAIIGLISPQ